MKNLRNKQTIATNKQFQAQNLSDALLTKVAGGRRDATNGLLWRGRPYVSITERRSK